MAALPKHDPAPGSDVLAALVAARREAERAERRCLRLMAEYAAAHPAPGIGEAGVGGREQVVELAGAGAPGVSEFAIADLAAALGLSTRAAKLRLGQALELSHRLPRIWAAVCDEPAGSGSGDNAGEMGVPAWRARMVAERTVHLTAAAAAYVDAQVAPPDRQDRADPAVADRGGRHTARAAGHRGGRVRVPPTGDARSGPRRER